MQVLDSLGIWGVTDVVNTDSRALVLNWRISRLSFLATVTNSTRRSRLAWCDNLETWSF